MTTRIAVPIAVTYIAIVVGLDSLNAAQPTGALASSQAVQRALSAMPSPTGRVGTRRLLHARFRLFHAE